MNPIEHKTPSVPRKWNGEISERYIGRQVMVIPDARPTNIRPKSSNSTEEMYRQNWKQIEPIVKRTAHVRYDRFLENKFIKKIGTDCVTYSPAYAVCYVRAAETADGTANEEDRNYRGP